MQPMPRYSLPPGLKCWLVLIWNAAHEYAWHAYDYLNAIGHGRFQRCEACGRFRPMLYRRRVIPRRLEEVWGLSPRLARALAQKESGDCAHCGTKLRGRRLAQIVMIQYPIGTSPALARCLADWVKDPAIRQLRVAEINRIDGLHEQLLQLPHFFSSDFAHGSDPGATVQGVRSEDLTRLTYPDSTFDLVLTSETLKHVPDLEAALKEIHRVLVPGGRHLFTIPVLPGIPRLLFGPSLGLMAPSRIGLNASVIPAATSDILCSPNSAPIWPIYSSVLGSSSTRISGFRETMTWHKSTVAVNRHISRPQRLNGSIYVAGNGSLWLMSGGIGQPRLSEMARSSSPSSTVTTPSDAMHAGGCLQDFPLELWGRFRQLFECRIDRLEVDCVRLVELQGNAGEVEKRRPGGEGCEPRLRMSHGRSLRALTTRS